MRSRIDFDMSNKCVLADMTVNAGANPAIVAPSENNNSVKIMIIAV